VDTKEAARREALRAVNLLGDYIAIDTVETVPAQRRYGGAVIALNRNPAGNSQAGRSRDRFGRPDGSF
jgi:hypothetical protein